MQVGGTRRFAAPRERVFQALVDPHELSRLMPGVQRVEVESDDEWVAVVRPPFGPGPSLKLDLHVTHRSAPEQARLTAFGKSLVARLSIDTAFELAEDGDQTDMAWTAEVELAGLLAGFGSRTLEPVVRQQAERALDRLQEIVESA